MRTFVTILAFALCTSAILVAGLNATPYSVLTDVVNKLVTKAKPKLKDLAIPIIDLQERGNITNARLQNLDTFVVTKTEVGNVITLEVKQLCINVDALKLLGDFNFVNIKLPVIGTVSGKGSIDLSLDNVDICGRLVFKTKGLGLAVKDISDITVVVSRASAALQGIDGRLADAVNAALTQIIPVSLPKLIGDKKVSIINWLNDELL